MFTVQAHAAPSATVDIADVGMLDAWLRVVGPTAAVLWQHLARRLGTGLPVETSAAELSAWSGVAERQVWLALDRLAGFGVLVWLAGDVVTIAVMTGPPRWMQRRPQAVVS